MDFLKKWTVFALEAEHDAFGFKRIVDAHNAVALEVEQLRKHNAELQAIITKHI